MNKKLIIIIGVLIFFFGCKTVRVKSHWGYMGPSTYEATDGTISVFYYNGNCCCVAEQVLINLADRANRGEFQWSIMADKAMKDKMLEEECQRMKNNSDVW